MKKKYIVPRTEIMEMTVQPLMAGSGRPTTLRVRNSIGTDNFSNFEKPLTDVGLSEGDEDSYAKGFKPVGAWNDSWEDE